ncbi:hypothetical protein OW763_09770 [Clostridium aestuarii]|uniref:Uncharacterized protein n=1 Tax=Clostridium aestuarii TaxID=338193 RepID=A0ABT4D066_9CLOT|nr:hypothetical protein [Clostridium aestuarii]MCY6484626.1 hypothetical protein [Clostridium aestuarii]
MGNIYISSRSKIRVNTVVLKDTAYHSTAVRIPARIINKKPTSIIEIKDYKGEKKNFYNEMVI